MNATSNDYNSSQEPATCLEYSYTIRAFVPAFLPPLLCAAFAVFFVAGLLLNGAIVLLVVKFKALQCRDLFVTLQVVAADLIVVSCLPFAVGTLYGGLLVLFPPLCYAVAFVKLFVNFLRFMIMFVHTLDRFCCVFFPFAYATYGKRICVCLSVAAWTLSAIVASVPFTIDCYGYQPTFGFCMIQPFCNSRCRSITIGLACVMVTLGGIIPAILYTLMFVKARKMANLDSQATPALNSASSNQTRTRTTFLWLFVALLGCSVPLCGAMVSWNPLYYAHKQAYFVYFGLSMAVFETIIIADPIMISRHRDLRMASEEVFKGVRKCSLGSQKLCGRT